MKYRYSVDQNNSLSLKVPGSKRAVPARGRFKIDKNNKLIYLLNEPCEWKRKYKLPSKMIFEGKWGLDRNHNLELTLEENRSQFKSDTLTIRGNIIKAGSDTIVFEAKSIDQNGLLHLQMLELGVRWSADEVNRLCFSAKKRASDIVVLQGEWLLDKNQKLTYTYERQELKRKTKLKNTLVFEGFWQIADSKKLVYILKGSPDSRFEFRAQIQSPTIYPQEGAIKFLLGAGAKKTSPKAQKTISLYGAWKFSKRLGLSFEVDYQEEKVVAAEFGVDAALNKANQVSLALKTKEGKPLGVDAVFTHKFLKQLDAEVFLKLKDSKDEAAASIGMRIPF